MGPAQSQSSVCVCYYETSPPQRGPSDSPGPYHLHLILLGCHLFAGLSCSYEFMYVLSVHLPFWNVSS